MVAEATVEERRVVGRMENLSCYEPIVTRGSAGKKGAVAKRHRSDFA